MHPLDLVIAECGRAKSLTGELKTALSALSSSSVQQTDVTKLREVLAGLQVAITTVGGVH